MLDAQHFGVPQRRRRIFIVGCLGDNGNTPAKILAIPESRAGYLEASQQEGKDSTRGTSKRTRKSGNGVGNFELYDFPKDEISPTLNAERARDTMTWWDGQDTAASLTVTSNEQRMPDKGRMQMVVVPDPVE